MWNMTESDKNCYKCIWNSPEKSMEIKEKVRKEFFREEQENFLKQSKYHKSQIKGINTCEY